MSRGHVLGNGAVEHVTALHVDTPQTGPDTMSACEMHGGFWHSNPADVGSLEGCSTVEHWSIFNETVP